VSSPRPVQGCTSESQYAILEPTPNGSAAFAIPALAATCRKPRLGASSSYLSDCDCHGLGAAFRLADPIRSQLGNVVRRGDSGFCSHAFHLVDQNIPLSGYAGARESTHYRHRQGRAIPLQSQPIYLAFSLFQTGIALGVNDAWILVTLLPAISVMSFVVIPREERYLEARFGEEYARYKASVRRWL
jgi:hypothetical protein